MRYLLPAILAILVIFVAVGMDNQKGITGNAVATGQGCCLNSCTQSGATECPADQFLAGESCREVRECNIGCCQDTEGYCYSNYVRFTCEVEGAKFIGARECPEFQECLVAPTEPADPQGYPYINNDGVIGLTINPPAGLKDEQFTLTAFTFKDQSNVKIRINNSNTIKDIMALDGAPNDQQMGDNGYTATFDSSQIPQTTTIQTLTAQALLNDIPTGPQFPFFVSPNGCLPLFDHTYNESKQSIVFTHDPSLHFIDIQGRAQTITANIVKNATSLLEDYNLYYHKNPTNTPKSACAQINNENRITVHLSLSSSGCLQEGNLVTTQNDIHRLANRPITSTNFTQNFCSYVTSPLEQQAAIYESLLDPEVEILSPPNASTITTSTTLVTFKVNDNNKNASFRYRILYNENANEVAWGYGIVGEQITQEIPTQDGLNAILVKVEDIKGNPGANYTIIQSNQSNFFVETNLVEGQVYTNGINFDVTYTHNDASNISYLVYDRTVLVGQGIAQNATPSPVELDLRSGPHDLRVVAFDNNQKRASTKKTTVVQLNAFQPVTTQTPQPTATSPITASVVYDPYGGTSDSNNPSDRVSGINQSVIGPDGFKYFPIDLNGLYSPQQLCGLPDAEPGIKYISIDCINSDFSTELEALTDLKERGEKSYEYTFNYDILTCSIGTHIDIYMQTCINPTDETIHPAIKAAVNSEGCYRETVERVTLDEGYRIVDSTTYKSFGDFNDLCFMVSDPSVEQAMPYCIPFSEPECKDGIDNDGDGSCDFGGCGTLPADPGCSDPNDNREDDGTPQCSDGIDNDNDGLCDATGCLGLPADPACLLGATPLPAHNNEASGTTQCQDGQDNDGDGTCDYNGCTIGGFAYPKDPACISPSQNNEAAATTACQDGVDNDGDGTCDYNGCIDHLGQPIPPDAACFTSPECYVDNSCPDKTIITEFASFYPCDVSDQSQFSASGTALRVSDGYKYNINYEFFACRENTIVEVILDGEARSRVDEVILDKDDSHTDSRAFDNDVLYTTLCLKASDSSFGTQCVDLQLI